MAKKSQRRPVRYERDQSGCMWGLISMFDFRHGRTTQKLLADKRRGSKHAFVAGSPKNRFDILTNLDENIRSTIDGEESMPKVADAGKPSVKKLMEEEMFIEQDKKEMKNGEIEPKESKSEHGGQKKKNRRKSNKSRSKSCDGNIEDLNVTEILESGRSHQRNKERQSTKSLDIDEIMEEFCQQIHHKSISSIKHDKNGEVQNQRNQNNPDLEEKLSEAVKLLISQKLINGKHVSEDGYHLSEEVRDAIQILSSDEELFVKLLQDPKSVMVRNIQSLRSAWIEKDEGAKSIGASDMLEPELPDLRQPDEVIKQRKFFSRKSKSVDKIQSKEDVDSQASNRIVILKPGPAGSPNPVTQSSHSSPFESKFTARDKGPNDRAGSHFFLNEIKRKFRHVLGKEKQEFSTDGSAKRFPDKNQTTRKDRGFKDNAGRSSPSKDHFFIEKVVAKPPTGCKKGEKTSKMKECETSMGHESVNYPKQRAPNIYVEARKHLSEMLSGGARNNFSSKQVPKTLGRILSLTEYNYSPVGSPGRDLGENLVTAQMRFFAKDNCQKQENDVAQQDQPVGNLEIMSSISGDSTNDKAQVLSNTNSGASNLEVRDTEGETTISSIQDETPLEGDVVSEKAGELVDQGDDRIMDAPLEPSNSFTTRDEQDDDISEVCDGTGFSECLNLGLNIENEPVCSPITSPSTSSVSKKVEDLESVTILERPSPVSVLEPLFTEDDVSPASIRSQPVELPIQPLRIEFEEHNPSTPDQCTYSKTGTGDTEAISEYVKAVLQASGMNWDELCIRSYSSNQLIDLSVFNEVEFCPNQLCCDKELLFDGINEVLVELYGCYLGCYPELSFVRRTIRPPPNMKTAIYEVCEGVYWHLLPLPLPSTLDQLVNKDMAKMGGWMDLQLDIEAMIAETGEAILQDLMEETILSWPSENSESVNPLISAEMKENEISIDL